MSATATIARPANAPAPSPAAVPAPVAAVRDLLAMIERFGLLRPIEGTIDHDRAELVILRARRAIGE